MTTKIEAIASLRPGAVCRVVGDVVEWLDEVQAEPAEAEIQAEIARLEAQKPRKEAEQLRAAAYAAEADPLFFKSQRGEATTAEWEAKVAEIKARFPYPEEA